MTVTKLGLGQIVMYSLQLHQMVTTHIQADRGDTGCSIESLFHGTDLMAGLVDEPVGAGGYSTIQ
ncbi:hypothetical protein [Sporisorium scitamineum]|uniref:Uncharacterized protein n=1 Tax=Sporisorium scitamineum TaxID=49012 RepID=A0A0F7S0X9_9BASI|nr:hypothetical protein [Sporisorium scitamineum]